MAIQTRRMRSSETIDHQQQEQRLIRDHDHTKLVRLKRKSQQQPKEQENQLPDVPSTETMIHLISTTQTRAAFAVLLVSTLLFAQTCQCDTQNSMAPKKLLSLADIERQHFKLVGPLSSLFLDQRPSKFDYEYHSESSLASGSGATSGGTQIKRHNNNLQTPPSVKKADDGMRQIMAMHEQIASSHNPYNQMLSQHMAPPMPVNSIKSPVEPTVESNQNHQQGRWRDLVKSPVKMASSLMMGQPTKLMSQMFTYVTPLIGPVSVNSTRARALTSFYGRALSGGKPSKLETSRPSVTSMPQNMFLSKPEAVLEIFEHKDHHRAASSSSTPPSTLMGSFTGSGNDRYSLAKMAIRMAKKTLPSSDDIVKDLLADSSSIVKALAENPLGTSLGASRSARPSAATTNSNQEVSPPKILAQVSSVPSHEGESNPAKDEPTRSYPKSPTATMMSTNSWIKRHTSQKAHSYLQDSLRDLILLSQLPILSGGPISTAPSVLERGGKLYGMKKGGNVTTGMSNSYIDPISSLRAIDELLRLAYILTTGVRRKRDPLKALGSQANPLMSASNQVASVLSSRSLRQLMMPNYNNSRGLSTYATDTNKRLRSIILSSLPKNGAKPRGVVWDMATDPSLAVTVFHLIERASVALPLGFLLMPIVQMIRNPLNGFNLGRILPPRASHRSVELEELAKRLDSLDKMLSRAMRPTHRESFIG